VPGQDRHRYASDKDTDPARDQRLELPLVSLPQSAKIQHAFIDEALSTLIPILLWCSSSCKSSAWYDCLRCCSSRSTRNDFFLAVCCSTSHLSSWEHCNEDRHWCPNAIQGATDNEFLSSMPRVSPSCRRSCANVCFSSSALYSRRDLRLFFSSKFSLPIRICLKF
jgi:hypothetical protein